MRRPKGRRGNPPTTLSEASPEGVASECGERGGPARTDTSLVRRVPRCPERELLVPFSSRSLCEQGAWRMPGARAVAVSWSIRTIRSADAQRRSSLLGDRMARRTRRAASEGSDKWSVDWPPQLTSGQRGGQDKRPLARLTTQDEPVARACGPAAAVADEPVDNPLTAGDGPVRFIKRYGRTHGESEGKSGVPICRTSSISA